MSAAQLHLLVAEFVHTVRSFTVLASELRTAIKQYADVVFINLLRNASGAQKLTYMTTQLDKVTFHCFST